MNEHEWTKEFPDPEKYKKDQENHMVIEEFDKQCQKKKTPRRKSEIFFEFAKIIGVGVIVLAGLSSFGS